MIRRQIAFLWAHQRKNRLRTPGKSTGVKILVGVVYIFLLLELLGFGIMSKAMVLQMYPDKNPVWVANSFLLYWFLIEFTIRYMVQSLPVMDIVPYLPLPVKKKAIISYLQIRGFTHPANYLSLLIFIPFALSASANFSSVTALLTWLFTILSLIWLAAICALHVKRKEVSKPASSFLLLVLIAVVCVADYWGWPFAFSFRDISSLLFSEMIRTPLLILTPLILAAFVVWMNFRFMSRHTYIDEAIQKKQDRIEMRGSFLSKYFGFTGVLMDLDIKLAWRNKRTRSQVYMIGIFLFYPLLIYSSPHLYDNLFYLCMFGVFVSGVVMSIFGPMPYDSAFFEGMMSRLRLTDYVKARYTLYVLLSAVTYFISLPYLFFGMEIFKINLSCFLYNLGVTPFLFLHMAAYHRKRVELSKSSTMNMQGVTFTQMAVTLAIFFLPATLTAVFQSIWPIAILGIGGMIAYKWQLKWVTQSFTKQKYKMIHGFRK